MTTQKWHNQNKIAWNEAAAQYEKDHKEAIQFLKNGGQNLMPEEKKLLGDLSTCSHALHLQCAGGTDTLSLLHRGAHKVTGIDISDRMIELAKKKSEALKMNVEWYCCDILDTPSQLNESCDLVYTGKGAINWVHDLERWAKVVHRLLKPGGRFLLFDGHPFAYFFSIDTEELKMDPSYPGCFSSKVFSESSWPETYIDPKLLPEKPSESHERSWPLSSVVNSLINTGLTIKHLGEYPSPYWEEFPNLEESQKATFPNTFSLLAIK